MIEEINLIHDRKLTSLFKYGNSAVKLLNYHYKDSLPEILQTKSTVFPSLV